VGSGSGDAWREEKHEKGGWSRPAGNSAGDTTTAGNDPAAACAGGTVCPYRGGIRATDAQDLAGGGRGREERGAGDNPGKSGVGRARMTRKVCDLFN
jgi:hypothetical protein